MIESCFVRPSTRARYLDAPLLKERDNYLSHLLRQGTNQKLAKDTATILQHGIRLLKMTDPRHVSQAEVIQASIHWATEGKRHPNADIASACAQRFARKITSWLRFNGLLTETQIAPHAFDPFLLSFLENLRSTRSLTPGSIASYKTRLKSFLHWLAERQDRFECVTLKDVEAFLDFLRNEGWRPGSVLNMCQALRSFFRFCGAQNCCERDIDLGIRSPRHYKSRFVSRGPSWKDVRRMLRPETGATAADLRTTAIISLCSIYGLRSGEVVGLQLTDFDWYNETFTVRRSKNQRIQEFPIQHEVGEAILQYLQKSRPTCSCRNLFVTWRTPYRPMLPSSLFKIISNRMKVLNIQSVSKGGHSLRHACATRLLKNGMSLPDIAEFLGHNGSSAVGNYARYNPCLLRRIADFSLAGVR